MCEKNISLITYPTKATQQDIIKLNWVEKFKVIYLLLLSFSYALKGLRNK